MGYMQDHWIGFLIVGLIVVIVPTIFGLTTWLAKRRWRGDDVQQLGGVLVRFARGQLPPGPAPAGQALFADVQKANTIITAFLQELFPNRPELWQYRVEVVPPGEVRTSTVPGGKLPDGSSVGGSVRREGVWPFQRWYVAVVINERTGKFIAHEVLRHILPMRMHGTWDFAHELEGFAEMEAKAKARIEGAA